MRTMIPGTITRNCWCAGCGCGGTVEFDEVEDLDLDEAPDGWQDNGDKLLCSECLIDPDRAPLIENQAVVKWIAKRRRKGRTDLQILHDSRHGGVDRWPLGYEAQLGEISLIVLEDRRRRAVL